MWSGPGITLGVSSWELGYPYRAAAVKGIRCECGTDRLGAKLAQEVGCRASNYPRCATGRGFMMERQGEAVADEAFMHNGTHASRTASTWGSGVVVQVDYDIPVWSRVSQIARFRHKLYTVLQGQHLLDGSDPVYDGH